MQEKTKERGKEVMEALKKIGCMIALMLMLIGSVWSLVALGQIGEWVAFVGCCCVIAAAIPTGIRLVKYLLG